MPFMAGVQNIADRQTRQRTSRARVLPEETLNFIAYNNLIAPCGAAQSNRDRRAMDAGLTAADCPGNAPRRQHYEKNSKNQQRAEQDINNNNSNIYNNGAVHIFTGNEKQRRPAAAMAGQVVYDRNVDRVRPQLDNEWSNYENTPNRAAQETFHRNRSSIESAESRRSSARDGDDDEGPISTETYRTVVENAMNVAFLAANTNQLRLLTETQQEAPSYQACLGMVITSLVLQVLVGISMVTISVSELLESRDVQQTNRGVAFYDLFLDQERSAVAQAENDRLRRGGRYCDHQPHCAFVVECGYVTIKCVKFVLFWNL